MTKKDWFIVIVPLLIVWTIDRVTKIWALSFTGLKFHGVIGLTLHKNPGAILGLFSDLPPILRVVSLSTGGAFLLFSYVIVQFLLPIKSLNLRSGMSILIGGILGNVTDRIVWGSVVDFLLIGSTEFATPAFNLADALQWVGYGMIVYSLIREREILWPSYNVRRSYWVNPKFQLKYCFILMGAGIGFSIIAATYSYTFLRVTIMALVGRNSHVLDQYLIPFLLTFLIISIAITIMMFLLGRILSHQIAGPLYAFEKYLDDILSGNDRPFKLRTKDDFQHLVELAETISKKIKNGRNHTNLDNNPENLVNKNQNS